MFKFNKWGILAGGVLLGSYGVKLLTSRDAKKAYTQATAAVLRMKDQVVKDFTVLGENCGDIAADAKAINEARAEKIEAEMVENAKEVLEKAAAKEEEKVSE